MSHELSSSLLDLCRRRPKITAALAVAAIALGLNTPAIAERPERPQSNVVCEGSQPINPDEHPSTTVAGILEADVGTPPKDGLKQDGTLQYLAKEIAGDPWTLQPTDRQLYYYIPPNATAGQVTINHIHPVDTFYWPEECYRIDPQTNN